MVRTANEKRDVNATMVRTSNEKRVVVGTESGTNQDYHGRILKTHSRSGYNSTSDELVDENQEGFTSDLRPRIPRIVGQSNSTTRCAEEQLGVGQRTVGQWSENCLVFTLYQSPDIWNWYYGGCFG